MSYPFWVELINHRIKQSIESTHCLESTRDGMLNQSNFDVKSAHGQPPNLKLKIHLIQVLRCKLAVECVHE